MINNSPVVSHNRILFSVCFLLLYYYLQKCFKSLSYNEKLEVDRWIVKNNFEMYRYVFNNKGLDKLVDFANLNSIPELTAAEEDRVKRSTQALKQKLILNCWLESLKISSFSNKLTKEEVNSMEDVYSMDDVKAHEIMGRSFAAWSRGRQMLPKTKEALEVLKMDLWQQVMDCDGQLHSFKTMWFNGSIFIISISAAGLITLAFKNQLWFAMRSDTSLLHVITGRYLDPNMCSTHFSWSDPYPVGETLTFVIRFFQRNGLPYPVCDKDNVTVEISFGVRKISSVLSLGGTAPEDANQGTVKFTVRHAGEYLISILIKNVHVRNSPFVKRFLPGPVDPSKTKFERHSSIVICCLDVLCSLAIQPRDSFQNLCLTFNALHEVPVDVNLDLYHSVIKQGGDERTDICFQSFSWDKSSTKIQFDMIFLQEGFYQVQVYYADFLLQNGDFTCVVLNRSDYDFTMRNLKSRSISYEGKLIRVEGEPPFKPKKVVMFVSPKQFTIKEFVLKFLLKRVATFRLCPSTKLQLLDQTANGVPSFCVEDGCQPTIYIAAMNRNLVAATFTKFLLNNIGGSETFAEKQYFFYYEVRRYHQKHKHEPITLKVNRQDLLQSSLKATKNFTVKEWCNNFEVVFQGEQGIDWGGLRKEWFQLTCDALFNPNKNLFKAFSDNPQVNDALVHPNKSRPSNLKLKYYEFAGRLVGKCLYESALGGSYSQFVIAKFTRSFLAQLIGLRINHSYFQFDDPDLYLNKVKYVLDHDVTDMELYFVDEEYDRNGQLIKVVDLIPNGSKTKVTNNLKRQYLDSLAQYRLSTSVKDEIETFLKGLNEIIPDNLLCIFDENELELLLCGTGEYSITDLRAHHLVNYGYPMSPDFERILKWFWIAISNFTTEEMARLLQFTTGSSQLPPGGFKDLIPQFHIIQATSFGNLPTAHTCFNQLWLPDYDTYEQFEKCLLLAITEGTEGFGLI